MYKSILEALRMDFITVRYLHIDDNCDTARLNSAVEDMRSARSKIKKSKLHEKWLYVYCIDTLIELINEGDRQKVYDFADTVHNVPEIGLERRNVYSFHREIKAFQRKYGESYFSGYNYQKIRPKFTKNAPENAAEYFKLDSDEAFKAQHPVGYVVLVLIGITVLLLPLGAFAAYTCIINPAPEDWRISMVFVGMISTFVMGIGFFNIVAAFLHQYLGHKLTAGCILGGGAATALVLLLIYC